MNRDSTSDETRPARAPRTQRHGNGNGNGNGDGNTEPPDADTARRRIGHRPGEGLVLLLSIEEAARALRLGRSKTYELIAAGELEVVHIGRCARVPLDAAEAYVERLRRQGQP